MREKTERKKKTFILYFTMLCSHFLNTMCIMFSPFVAWLWHLEPHNERLVCTDTFALRCRNTILECLTWWKEQETENVPKYCIQLKGLLLIKKVYFPSNLQCKILTGLSVSTNKRVNKHAFLFWVCSCMTVVCVSVKHTVWGKAMKPRYGKKEWSLWHHVLPFPTHLHGTWASSDWDCHPFQLFPFTPAPTSPLLSTLLPSTIPFLSVLSLNWEAERQKGSMFSAMCWLIVMAQSLYPDKMAKRLYPEHVLACSLQVARNEKRMHFNCPSSHRRCTSEYESLWLFFLSPFSLLK